MEFHIFIISFFLSSLMFLNISGELQVSDILRESSKSPSNITDNVDEDLNLQRSKSGEVGAAKSDGDTNPGQQKVCLTDDPNYEGKKLVIWVDTNCKNLPKKFDNKAGSIDTRGSCVIAFDDKDCLGEGVKILRHCPEGMNLGKVGMDNAISSLRLCSEFDAEIVTFYTQPHYLGKSVAMRFPLSGTCVNMNYRYNDKISSIYFKSDSGCIVIWKDFECTGVPVRLRPSTVGIDDLAELGMENQVSSAQVCSAVDQGRMIYIDQLPVNKGTTNTKIEDKQKDATTELENTRDLTNDSSEMDKSGESKLTNRDNAGVGKQSNRRKRRSVNSGNGEF